jgi:tetratricopeptide (TPR) repeat protein
VFNNRASIYISKAIYETFDPLNKRFYLDTALLHIQKCINHYSNWIDRFGNLSKEALDSSIQLYFSNTDEAFLGKNVENIAQKRVKDLVLAQKETPRRLSVAYTNLGIIQRHQLKQKDAIESYLKAISLWKDNPSALSNLNVLYGKPPKDRSILKKLFPPNKND